MLRSSGHVWLVGLVAAVLLIAATAVPHAAASSALRLADSTSSLPPLSTQVNPRTLAGIGALVLAGLQLMLYVYRRRPYIVFWICGWLLTAISMFVAGKTYESQWAGRMAYGCAQFIGITAGLLFVVSADAYRTRAHMRRAYVVGLLPVLLWFVLAPIPLGTWVVYAPGHLLIAGALAAAGVGHLMLLRYGRMLGAGVVGTAFLALAGSNAWLALAVAASDGPGSARLLYTSLTLYLVTALGMQLLTFEDMTFELRRTNRRLETAQAKLRRMVITDPLTGCRNRRFFDEIIGRELQRHQRYGIPLSILFIDVNHFKEVNDTLGHEAGDRVLQEVAAFLLCRIREADYVFRWGGDEFLILLSCSEEEAMRRGIALQTEFGESAETASLPAGLGLSIGCAAVDSKTDDIMTLIKMADERMYANKRATKKTSRRRAVAAR